MEVERGKDSSGVERGKDRRKRGVQSGGVIRKVGMGRERRGDARKERKGECEEKVYCGTYVQ